MWESVQVKEIEKSENICFSNKSGIDMTRSIFFKFPVFEMNF